MRSWKSSLKGVIVLSARSTHSLPSTLRLVLRPFSKSRAMRLPSGEIGVEPRAELFHRAFGSGDERPRRPVGIEVRLHARRSDHERGGGRVEEIEAAAESR